MWCTCGGAGSAKVHKPTRKKALARGCAFIDFYGSVLGEVLISGTKYVEWTGNLADRADVAVRAGAAAMHEVIDKTFWRRVRVRGSLDAPDLFKSRLSSV
jgi:hypothetical protein